MYNFSFAPVSIENMHVLDQRAVLYLVCSLHFVPGLHSQCQICSLHFALRDTQRFVSGKYLFRRPKTA